MRNVCCPECGSYDVSFSSGIDRYIVNLLNYGKEEDKIHVYTVIIICHDCQRKVMGASKVKDIDINRMLHLWNDTYFEGCCGDITFIKLDN